MEDILNLASQITVEIPQSAKVLKKNHTLNQTSTFSE